MRKFEIILLALFLCGCLSEQKMQLAACELEETTSITGQDWKQRLFQDDFISKCVRSNGYEFALSNAKCEFRNPNPKHRIYRELHCYRPESWLGSLAYNIETAFLY